MSEHTPGPWESMDAECNFPEGKMTGMIYGAVNDEIAFTAMPMGETQEQAQANARLIASAPELLEALEWIAQPRELNEDPYAWIARAKGLAETAIAKAKGDLWPSTHRGLGKFSTP